MNTSHMTPEQHEAMAAKAFGGGNKGSMIGPYLMGVVIDLLFLGIVIAQAVSWASVAHMDKMPIRFTMIFCIVASLAISVYGVYFLFSDFVYDFGTYVQFTDARKIQIFCLVDALIAVGTQCIYAERTYRLLGKRKALAKGLMAFLIVAMLVELGGAIAGVPIVYANFSNALTITNGQPALYCWLSGQLAADLAITVSTTFALWKSKTGWSHTDKVITKLLAFTVETQLPPTLIALFFMIYYEFVPRSTVIPFCIMVMSKPYVIGLLGMALNRSSMRQQMANQGSSSDGNKNVYNSNSGQNQTYNYNPRSDVVITTETYTQKDQTPRFQIDRPTEEAYELNDLEYASPRRSSDGMESIASYGPERRIGKDGRPWREIV